MGIVTHDEPIADVVVTSRRIKVSDAVFLDATDGTRIFLAEEDGRITVPLSAFANAQERRLEMWIRINGVRIPGYILSLPTSESESFSIEGAAINKETGLLLINQNYSCTDFVSVRGVRDIALSVQAAGLACALYGYNENKEPIGPIVETGARPGIHVVPDGSYEYVRASNLVTVTDAYFILYFED